MENKYLNEAIIGNKKMIATFTAKGEMQRVYFPSKDNRQYINIMIKKHIIAITLVFVQPFIKNESVNQGRSKNHQI